MSLIICSCPAHSLCISWSTQTLSQTITPFVSTDAGASWAPLDVRPGAKQFAMLEHGGVLVATDIYDPRGQGSTAVHFSVDEGATWATASIPFARPVHIVGLYPEPGEATDKLTIFGYLPPNTDTPFRLFAILQYVSSPPHSSFSSPACHHRLTFFSECDWRHVLLCLPNPHTYTHPHRTADSSNSTTTLKPTFTLIAIAI